MNDDELPEGLPSALRRDFFIPWFSSWILAAGGRLTKFPPRATLLVQPHAECKLHSQGFLRLLC